VVGQVGSLIKYFTVPTGIINGVVQDWRTVFHTGANKLNDCEWIPLLRLQTINSLLRIADKHTLMANWDMGGVFLNFNLHPYTVQFACFNIEALDFTSKECPHQWMCWTHNLMGFKVPPYNSVRICLVAEEIIWGIVMTRITHFSGLIFVSTCLAPRTTSLPRHGYRSSRRMNCWPATLYASLMTSGWLPLAASASSRQDML
jgi:hypothetical protein